MGPILLLSIVKSGQVWIVQNPERSRETRAETCNPMSSTIFLFLYGYGYCISLTLGCLSDTAPAGSSRIDWNDSLESLGCEPPAVSAPWDRTVIIVPIRRKWEMPSTRALSAANYHGLVYLEKSRQWVGKERVEAP